MKPDTSKIKIDNSIFEATFKQARLIQGAGIFFILMPYSKPHEFGIFCEDGSELVLLKRSYEDLKFILNDLHTQNLSPDHPQIFDNGSRQQFAISLLRLLDLSKILILPFAADEAESGFAIWCWKNDSPILDEDLIKASLIGEQISLSLKAFRNERSSQKRGDKLTALLKLSTAIYSSLNYSDVLDKAVRLSTEIMHADGGTIFLLDQGEAILRPLITIDDRYQEELSKVTLILGEGISGKVAQTGIGIISNHSENDPRSVQVPGTPVEKESLISAPLTWSGEAIGVITLWSYGGKVFLQEDLEVLTIFARQTADAIENAKLYESLEKAYQELRATQEQLIMAEKLKALGDMAGGIAHDFNNALGTILGRTQLLIRRLEDPNLKKELEIIERVTLKGRRTVQRLQDFTHVSSRVQFSQVDFNKIVKEALETTRPAWKDNAHKLGITFTLHTELGLIPLIDGSHEELKEAISNVILNSVDALPDGGNIWVKTGMEDDKVVLEIRDDGTGMDENTKNKLFFPFFSTKGKKGVGMGLAIVYGILFRHHADIGVESSPGNGATFIFKFSPTKVLISESQPPARIEELRSLSILLIDDDTNLLDVVGEMVEFLNHRCTKADGGKVGLKCLGEGTFDLVITDLGMPEVSGWEIARFCRDQLPGTPIILISGWGAQLDSNEASQRVDAVLPKPFQINELKETIEKVISSVNKTRFMTSSIIS